MSVSTGPQALARWLVLALALLGAICAASAQINDARLTRPANSSNSPAPVPAAPKRAAQDSTKTPPSPAQAATGQSDFDILAPTGFTNQQAAAVRCPGLNAAMAAPGCPCTMHTNRRPSQAQSQQTQPSSLASRPLLGQISSLSNSAERNVCPAGYRCSPSAASDIVQAGWQPAASLRSSGWRNASTFASPDSGLGAATATTGICVACQLGEYCPPGTQEETWLSLTGCELNPTSSDAQGGSSSSSSVSSSSGSGSGGSCKGFKACPAGSYCPDAASVRPCEPGRFCPEASITSQPCNISGLLVWNPFRTVQSDPTTLLQELVNSNQPLGGNVCPANATSPLSGCPPGYFCPNAATQIVCPIAYYCPGHTSSPIPCPALASCNTTKMTQPAWSWLGLVFLLLLVLVLLTLLEYVRVAGRRDNKALVQDEEVMQLIGAVGYKMVCSGDSCSLQRTTGLQLSKPTPGFTQQMSDQATRMMAHPIAATKAWTSKVFRSLDLRSRSGSDLGDHKLINGSDLKSTKGAVISGSDGSGSSGSSSSAEAAHAKDHTVVTIPDEQQHVGGSGASPVAADASAAAQSEYQINPRLTLCFRDVWVADRPLEKGWTTRAASAAKQLCGKHSTSDEGGGKASDRSLADAKLACAACRGVKFIVPGVSGKFVHSQLHALMGPSGCGKTTLCKALAGRLPESRVCADVRVLCSTAADGFTSKTELAMSGSIAARHVSCSVAHMTGFVPQFDLLHETLTVQENLLQAAALRLPRNGHFKSHKARLRELNFVVGEVTALMALNKVIQQVVGSSSQRMLSGGQRKRVAIGVELVAKPSLLWLDEPTSGLDAAVAYDVVEALKNSSQRGMNILAVMHQPRCSIFNMFDSCLLLSSNGHVVYSGPRDLSLHYMAFVGFYKQPEENTADFLMDVIAGVVPRPGDPDYVPSHLATLWHRVGNIWLQQTRECAKQAEDFNQTTCLKHARQNEAYANFGLAGLPVPTAAASAGTVDWPWRPRDLEALLSRFHLLVDYDTGEEGLEDSHGLSAGGISGFRSSGGSGSTVMSYEGFLTFWDEAGVKDVMGEDQFDEFILGICEDFGMTPGKSITQAQFLAVLKAQLRAAAGGAPLPADVDAAAPETRLDQHQVDAAEAAAAATEEIHATRSLSSDVPSPFAAYHEGDQTVEHDVSTAAAAAAVATGGSAESKGADGCGGPVLSERCQAIKEYHAATKALAALTKENAPPEAASEDLPKLCKAAQAGDAAAAEVVAAVRAAAAAAEQHGGVPQADFFAAAKAAQSAAEAAGLGSVKSDLSRSGTGDLSSITSGLYGGKACQPGMLTCSGARMQQRMLQRQQSTSYAPAAPGVPRSSSSNQQQLAERQRALEAIGRYKRARRALVRQQRRHQTGMRQLEQVHQMRGEGEQPVEMPARNCESLEDARGKCLNTLGDYMLRQHLQQQQRSSSTDLDGQGSRGLESDAFAPGALGSSGLETLREYSAVEDTSPQPVDQEALPSKDTVVPTAEVAASNSAAASAAVLSRKLPSTARQLYLIIKRSARKLISCRHALMTDLLLTSVLGLALGVAQGRTADPGGSLLWMLITLLAFGCMMLTRSTISYGLERHIYLQLENQGGVSPTAWVFGHQIFDILALLLHPALFYAWMYVLTLSPVPGWNYYIVLLVVGWYTSGIGYLVSLLVGPGNVMITGLALALLLGGVANGVAPSLWQLDDSNPIVWLDALSYTRWGLQALYISWLTPSSAEKAPATAAFLSGLGFCGLQPSLLQALQQSGDDTNASSNSTGSSFNTSSLTRQHLWNLSSSQRADGLAAAAADNLRHSPPGAQQDAAAAAAMTQLWQYYSNPHMLSEQCGREKYRAYLVLLVMGTILRLLVWVVIKWKTHNKAQE